MTPKERLAERERILQSRQLSKLERFMDNVVINNRENRDRKQREEHLENLYQRLALEIDMKNKHHILDLILAANASYKRDYQADFIPKAYLDQTRNIVT